MAKTDEDSPLLGEASNSNSNPVDFSHGDERSNSRWAKLRRIAHENVEGTIDSPFEYTILGLIFANIVLLAVSTLVVDNKCFGSKCVRVGEKYDWWFELAEGISVIIFTTEYVLRMWACVEFPAVRAKGPVWGRFKYALTFFPIVDFLSIAPWWYGTLGGSETTDFATAIRVFRLIRLLKADKYLNAFSVLGSVLSENTNLLIASSFYALLTWIVSATALFFLEQDNPLLGTHFQSIPQAMFPVLLMLTGEFPLADFTAKGQVIAGAIAVVAVAIFAVPSAVLASGFIQAVEKSTNREFTVDV